MITNGLPLSAGRSGAALILGRPQIKLDALEDTAIYLIVAHPRVEDEVEN